MAGPTRLARLTHPPRLSQLFWLIRLIRRAPVPQDLQMRLAHRGARLDAQLPDQAGPQVAVDGQGLRLATGAVQHEHQQPVEGLPQRVLRDEGGQLGCEKRESGMPRGTRARRVRGTPITVRAHSAPGVPGTVRARVARGVPGATRPPGTLCIPRSPGRSPACAPATATATATITSGDRPRKPQLGLIAPLQKQQPGLLQALDEGMAAELGPDSAERGAAPQRERRQGLTQRPCAVPPGMRGTRGRDVGLEDADVQLTLADPQEIPRRHRPQPLRIVEEPTQPGDVVLE